MAIVPEMDDVNKPSSEDDQSDISAQSTTSNIAQPTAAPATGGGQAVAGGAPKAGPSSSGNFQDFGKFKAANQNKLSALSNLATDTAKNNVNNTASAFANAGSAYKQGVEANKVDFSSGTTKEDGSYDVDAYTKKLQASANKVDTGETEGKLAGTQEYSALNAAEQQATGINSRAGTAAVLSNVQNGASAAAANQDSLLLQSMGDYRQKANEVAQSVKGTTANALTAQQEAIRNAGTAVNADNASGRQKALEALKNDYAGVTKDLDTKAAAAEAARVAGNTKASGDAQTQVNTTLRSAIDAKKAALQALPMPVAPPKPTNIFDSVKNNVAYSAAEAKYKADMDNYTKASTEIAMLGEMDNENALRYLGLGDSYSTAMNQFKNETGGPGITADNIYRDSPEAQAKIAALSKLLSVGGAEYAPTNTYNASVLDPMKSNALSGMDELIAKIKAGVDKKGYTTPVNGPTPSTDFAGFENIGGLPNMYNPIPLPVPTPAAPVSTGSSGVNTAKPTVTNKPVLR